MKCLCGGCNHKILACENISHHGNYLLCRALVIPESVTGKDGSKTLLNISALKELIDRQIPRISRKESFLAAC